MNQHKYVVIKQPTAIRLFDNVFQQHQSFLADDDSIVPHVFSFDSFTCPLLTRPLSATPVDLYSGLARLGNNFFFQGQGNSKFYVKVS